MAQLDTLISGEETRVDALLADTASPPSNYHKYILNRTKDVLGRMKQKTGEAAGDWHLRVNTMAQEAPSGDWSTSFWNGVHAAIASDTGIGTKGGQGRGEP